MKFLVLRCPDCKDWHTLSELKPINCSPNILGCPRARVGSVAIVQELNAVSLERLREEMKTIQEIWEEENLK